MSNYKLLSASITVDGTLTLTIIRKQPDEKSAVEDLLRDHRYNVLRWFKILPKDAPPIEIDSVSVIYREPNYFEISIMKGGCEYVVNSLYNFDSVPPNTKIEIQINIAEACLKYFS